MKFKCIEKIRDNSGRINLYLLEDENGLTYKLTAKEIKERIIKDYEITNLQMDCIGRLIDKKEKNIKEQDNKARYTLISRGIASYTGVDEVVYYLKFWDNITQKEVWIDIEDLKSPLMYRNEQFKDISIRKNGKVIINKDVPLEDIDSMLYIYISVKNNVDKLLENLLYNGGFTHTIKEGKIIPKNEGEKEKLENELNKLEEALETTHIVNDSLQNIINNAVYKLFNAQSIRYVYILNNEGDTDTFLSYNIEDVFSI